MSDQYRLVRLSLDGDTLLVLSVQVEPVLVSADERREAIAGVEKFMDGSISVAVDWDTALPKYRPILQHLSVDDLGNVWVQRDHGGGRYSTATRRKAAFSGR